MNDDSQQPFAVIHDAEAQCFRGNEGGILTYEMDSEGRLVIVHTEVPEALRGRGIAARLTESALRYAEQNSYPVVPQCEYAAAYMKRRGITAVE
jgi:predicted GNAT family acetyltransferase